MPFRALVGENVVWPDQVDDNVYVDCLNCEDKLTTVKGHRRKGDWVSRHFRHVREACGVVETDTHKLMKYVASRKLKRNFPTASVNRETQVPGTNRTADVLAKFNTSTPPFGDGIAVEAQFKNKDKDKLAVSIEYLNAGYSVIWVSESNFKNNWRSVDFEDITHVWPASVPNVETWPEPPAGIATLQSMEPEHYQSQATIPGDFIDSIEEELKWTWSKASGEYLFDYRRELSENNADRKCAVCQEPATHYYLQWDVISEYRCQDHDPLNDGTIAFDELQQSA